MKILLIGGTGQLGKTIQKNKLLFKGFDIFSPNSNRLDLSDQNSIERNISELKPDIIINCGAFTNVDEAENKKKISKLINSDGPKYLANYVNKFGSFLIHISTDYVFGGDKKGPYSNKDKISPINYYGFTKSDGEINIFNETNKCLIIRTASLISAYRGNFATLIISKLLNNENLNIINNQLISVTCCNYLTKCISSICKLYKKFNYLDLSDNHIINFTNSGYTNWFSVASKIREKILEKKIISNINPINAISSSEWESLANRPSDSRLLLDSDIFKKLNIEQEKWQEGIDDITNEYFITMKDHK